MISTPLITKIKTEGGTLYTFTSTSRDITRVATNSSNYSLSFSHFALLNLPHIKSGDMTEMSYINNIDDPNGYFKSVTSSVDTINQFIVKIIVSDKCQSKLANGGVYVVFDKPNGIVKQLSYDVNNNYYHCTVDSIIDDNLNEIKFHIVLKFDDDNNEYAYPDVPVGESPLVYNVDYVGNNTKKGIYLEQFENFSFNNSNDLNVDMAEHFQNYILNFEAMLMNRDDYDFDILRSPAERLFFNWLEKVGAIRFESAGKVENSKGYEEVYVEDVDSYGLSMSDFGVASDSSGSLITNKNLFRTVQYIGDIDVINQVSVNGDLFGEVYMYVPSGVGSTSKILFHKLSDVNYPTNTSFIIKDNSNKLVGRSNFKDEDRPIDEIRLQPIYDHADGGDYYLTNEGYCIDFNKQDIDYDNLNLQSTENFEFNCVLIYYDIKKETEDEHYVDFATNLYGVLFLDNFKTINVGDDKGYIATYPKYWGSEYDDGNAWAFKLDIKFDTAPTTTMIAADVDTYDNANDVKGFAMYMSVLNQMRNCLDIFHTQQKKIYELQDKLSNLESVIYTLPDLGKIQTDVMSLKYEVSNINTTNTNKLFDMISENSAQINKIINGVYPTKLALDTSSIQFKNGLKVTTVDDGDDEKTIIDNTLQKYKYIGKVSLDLDKEGNYIYPIDNYISFDLVENTNLLILDVNETDESDMNLDQELVINIIEDDCTWKDGQSVDITTSGDFRFNNIRHNSLKIITTLKDGRVIEIKDFTRRELDKMKFKSEIEIVCLNKEFNQYYNNDNFITIIR